MPSESLGTVLVLLILPLPSRLQVYDPLRLDSREVDIKLSLSQSKTRADTIFKYSDVSLGEDKVNHTGTVTTGKPIFGAEKHKTKPPKLGSTCKHENYEKLYSRYFAVDYTNYELRLHEHKLIETYLVKERDDAVAWGMCQYGGIRMQCGTKRRCECLSQKPPLMYVQKEDTCVGVLGSECTDNPKAPIKCDKGLKCEGGFCGGIEAAYQQMVARATFQSTTALLTSLSFPILTILAYF